MISMLVTGSAGLTLIRQFEGCVLHAYQDVVGVWTVGYGCTGHIELADGSTVVVASGLQITQADADHSLLARLEADFNPALRHLLGSAPATQNQFDAMTSLQFNIGTGALSRSHVLSYHLAGNYNAAALAFRSWDMAGGRVLAALLRRRVAEATLYLTGDAAAQNVPAAPAGVKATVVALQVALNAAGATPPLMADGVFGPLSLGAYQPRDALPTVMAAVRALQSALNAGRAVDQIDVDGWLGPQTARALADQQE